ncbi:MAG: flagellar basal body rod protein FlgB [Stygiobacter sp.]|jgi:flagellar basal-body rod protein FlgB|uniref:Flagellar basal body rod protein FlgB n=1 Tax=Stygiobacter electus TaxID=3032292 RepID=A0AAE3NZ19_9BACT|nr:flagellar basal body rod protein FlgB [Stygiobacter electus]MDF1611269.1 flagellar basal body rod protein FlgB [Stygiobacter electus]
MPSSIKLLTNLLDYCTEKNKVIAKNIANIGTENYRRQDVVFKDILQESTGSLLKKTNEKHLDIQIDPEESKKFEYIEDKTEEMDSGINNVNIEREMSELAENTLRFKFASRKVGDYYKTLQKVIKGGGVG